MANKKEGNVFFFSEERERHRKKAKQKLVSFCFYSLFVITITLPPSLSPRSSRYLSPVPSCGISYK